MSEERTDWEALARHFADELIERWHMNDWPYGVPSLAQWMGLTLSEYYAWVEGRYADVATAVEGRATKVGRGRKG